MTVGYEAVSIFTYLKNESIAAALGLLSVTASLKLLITVACEATLAVWSVRNRTLESGLLSFLVLFLTVTLLDDIRRFETSSSYLSFDQQEGLARKGGQVKRGGEL